MTDPEVQPSALLDTARGFTRDLAERSRAVNYVGLPASAVDRAKHCLLDWLGVTIVGASDAAAVIAREVALLEPGPLQAHVVGTSERLGVSQATLVNATAAHVLDFDDASRTLVHPSAPLLPAVVALAERDGFGGRDLITAFVAGVEAEARLAVALNPGHFDAGWHTTGTAGTIGAAAGTARLLGLDASSFHQALSIAASHAAGMIASFGTMCKPLNAGRAAANGLMAALLAQRGFTAPMDVIEMPHGFGQLHSASFTPAESVLDTVPTGLGVGSIVHKKHASCLGTHSTIEGILALRRRYSLTSNDVEYVVLRVPDYLLEACDIDEPRTGLEAKFSLPFSAALALSGRPTGPDGFTDENTADEALRTAAGKVRVVAVPTIERDHTTEVVLQLLDGRTLSTAVNVRTPATDDELDLQWSAIVAKFHDLAAPIIGESASRLVVECVAELERAESIAPIMALCVPM